MLKLYYSILAILEGSTCSFKERYKLYCPGCGATRALRSFCRLRFLDSLLSNPCVILIGLDVLLFVGLAIYERRTGSRKRYYLRALALLLTLVLWMLFALVRNLLLKYAGIDYLGDILPPA